MSKSQPLAEVFGFPILDKSSEAKHGVSNRLCPFNNIQPNCTKDKIANPLGVCSVYVKSDPVMVCPVRFNQNWLITTEAAKFFFPKSREWTSFREVPLKEGNGKSAGNIDFVVVKYDKVGNIVDYGAVEVQSVYITGNIRDPFELLIEDPKEYSKTDWSKALKYPKPDFLSSTRKRLAPQLLFKGSILSQWKRKIAVAIDEALFSTLPNMKTVSIGKANLLWMVYKLKRDSKSGQFKLALSKLHPTMFAEAMECITVPEIGPEAPFIADLSRRLRKTGLLSADALVVPKKKSR